ncbi:diguanylate cyclase [Thermomonas sp. HDW16]|uniref:diguanylate cyclase n=1 Tax=Thermomonas sp. HDW16 TaxID=2714945 RepID=UPI00140A7E9D|nr:diguanylate cyclase [Thermomonas sp. HDW16]QIL20808.1 diguanylate cyclase [Thermomonas sp. HDW16]
MPAIRNKAPRNDIGDASSRLRDLHRRVYRFRTLGMGLGLLPIAAVLTELHAAWPSWAWAICCCLLWPHLAYLSAARGKDPARVEIRNLMVDSMLAGSLVPLMQFNLLPSVMLMTVSTADKINAGVRGLWLRALPGMFLALLAMGAVNGFAVRYPTSTPVLLACLPIMIIHTLAVSASGYQLIRKVQKQNARLDELRRHDSLTGLESRGHWQEQVGTLFDHHASTGASASMLLVDVDWFKSINDQHGHATGDDVLRGIAGVIRAVIPDGSHAGRVGGDEFAIAVPVALFEAHSIAERIRKGVDTLQFPRKPPLQCSVSIGIAEPATADADLRGWMEAADRALYRAKAAGRNRVAARLDVHA